MANTDLYNASSRSLSVEIDIYFSSGTLTVTESNYLLSFDLLEELGADDANSAIGTTSSNELDIKLLNKDGLFSPTNSTSIYYGSMTAGTKVVARIKPVDSTEWDELGTFYVSDWSTEITSLETSVTCYDKLQSVLNLDPPAAAALSDISFVDAFNVYLNKLNIAHNVDTSINGEMSWWYPSTDVSSTLKYMTNACIAATFCGRNDEVEVRSMTKQQSVAATLTDGNQIISASIPSTISKEFDGVLISINNTQLSDIDTILTIKDYTALAGENTSSSISLGTSPVATIESMRVNSSDDSVDIVGYEHSTYTCTITTSNSLADKSTEIEMLGKTIEVVKETAESYGNSPMTFDNIYAQNSTVCDTASDVFSRYISNQIPTMELSIRGNPTLQLGDKINVISEKYNLNYTGVLQRASYKYAGSLSCTITLINSLIMEVS